MPESIAEDIEDPKKSTYKVKMKRFLDHWITQSFMTSLTVYILFADDIKMITTDSTADDPFSTVVVALMGIFSVELVYSCFCVDDYFLGFYFWLDIVSVASMLLDVTWFYHLIIASLSSTGTVVGSKHVSSIAKAGKGAKIGSRAIKILRILRIIRLVRISKLYKASENFLEQSLLKLKKNQDKSNNSSNSFSISRNKRTERDVIQGSSYQPRVQLPADQANNDNNAQDDGKHVRSSASKREDPNPKKKSSSVPVESRLGKKLSDLTTRRVIVLVLSMMLGIMLFNSSFYYDQLNSMDFGIRMFNDFGSADDPNFNLTFDIYVNEHMTTSSPIMFAQVLNLTWGNYNDTLILRDDEKIISSDDCTVLDIYNTTGGTVNNEFYLVCGNL